MQIVNLSLIDSFKYLTFQAHLQYHISLSANEYCHNYSQYLIGIKVMAVRLPPGLFGYPLYKNTVSQSVPKLRV